MAGGIASQGLKFLTVIYVARRFSSAEFGVFSFAWAIYAFLFVISHYGLPTFGAREVAREGKVSGSVTATIVLSRVGLALVSTLTGLLILVLVPGVSATERLLVLLFGLSNVFQAGFFDWIFQGLGRLETFAIVNVTWQTLWLVFTVLGVRFGGGVWVVGVAFLLSTMVAAAVSYGCLWSTVDVNWQRTSFDLWRDTWRTLTSGSALGVGTMAVTVLLWSDAIIVRFARGEQALAAYAAGNRAALALSMLSAFYMQGAFPLLSRASLGGKLNFTSCFQRVYGDLALIFLPGCVWAGFYAREILTVVFQRSEYLAGQRVFQVFLLVLWLLVVNNLYGMGVLVAFHRDRDYGRILLLTICVFLPVCLGLTLYKGILGASIAALVSQGFAFILFTMKSAPFARPQHAAALGAPVALGLVIALCSKFLGLTLCWSAGFLFLTWSTMVVVRFRTIHNRQGIA
jgi:O-antigen/teichoic acid export membrane protein